MDFGCFSVGFFCLNYFRVPLLRAILVFRFVESCEIILLQVVHGGEKGEKGGKEKRRKQKVKARIKAKGKARK